MSETQMIDTVFLCGLRAMVRNWECVGMVH